jgi:phosphopantothenate---cysteine ligase (CTP)
MKLLVTTGNTQTPIDQVRCITNIFSGRTGTRIALEAVARGHDVRLMTSTPELINQLASTGTDLQRLTILPYRTFDELAHLMEDHIRDGKFDAVVHSAAVSDYLLEGIYADPNSTPIDQSGKISSKHEALWMKLIPAPKLVDRIRSDWAFVGKLITFKLEVNIDEEELKNRATAAMLRSNVDLIVANRQETMGEEAFLLTRSQEWLRILRSELARSVVDQLSTL